MNQNISQSRPSFHFDAAHLIIMYTHIPNNFSNLPSQ